MTKKQVPEPDLPPPELFEEPIIPPTKPSRRLVATPEEIAATEPQTTDLTEEERHLFRSLLTVGKRSKTISVMDHTVEIQTLRVDDELRIGLYTKQYQDSGAFARAYQTAVCAAGVRSVDGRPLYESMVELPDEDEVFDQKVKVVKTYYPIVISQIYRSILDLETEFAELAQKLGKLPG